MGCFDCFDFWLFWVKAILGKDYFSCFRSFYITVLCFRIGPVVMTVSLKGLRNRTKLLIMFSNRQSTSSSLLGPEEGG